MGIGSVVGVGVVSDGCLVVIVGFVHMRCFHLD